MNVSSPVFGSPLPDSLVPRAAYKADAEFDITAMIDLVFMMNIYFLIGFVGLALNELDLPSASFVSGLDGEVATIISMVVGSDGTSAVVYLGDGAQGAAIHDPAEQQQKIADAVEQGVRDGRMKVLLKAEKSIRLREIARITGAASREGVTLHMAVMEKDDVP